MRSADVNGIDLGINRSFIEGFVGAVVIGEIFEPAEEAVEGDRSPGAVRGGLVFVDELAEAGEIGEALFGALLGGPPCGGEAGDVSRRVGEIVERERAQGGEALLLPDG